MRSKAVIKLFMFILIQLYIIGQGLCTTVNFDTPRRINGNQVSNINPQLATDGKGNWIIAWIASVSYTTNPDIFLSRSSDNGETWTQPFSAMETSGAYFDPENIPRIATDRKGKWVVVWYNSHLRYTQSSDNGLTWSAAQDLFGNPTRSYGQDIAADGQGVWNVVWESDAGILTARSTDMNLWSAPRMLGANSKTSTLEISNTEPRIATNGNGAWIVTWEHFISNPATQGFDDPSNRGLTYFTRSTNGGETWTDGTEIGGPSAFYDLAQPVFMDANRILVARRRWGWSMTSYFSHGMETVVASLPEYSWNTYSVESSVDASTLGAASDGENLWLAYSNAAKPLYSTDAGQTWAALDGPDLGSSPQIVYGGEGRWIAVWSNSGQILASIGQSPTVPVELSGFCVE